MKSKLFRLDLSDCLRGAAIAAVTTIIVGAKTFWEPLINYGRLPTLDKIETVLFAGLSAGIVYIGKNFFTNSYDEFGKKE